MDALLPADEGGSAVYVVGADFVAHQRKVKAGVRSAEKVQILTGAKAGEKVVVEGGVGLTDGAKVKVEKPGEPGDKKDEKKAGGHE